MQLEIGEIYEGVVKGITQYGAFVEVPGEKGERGQTGMVHISEVNEGFVRDIREHLKEGDTVRVKVIAFTPQGKISMSIKQANAPTEQESRPQEPKDGKQRPRREQQRPRTYEPKRSIPQSEMSFEDKLLYFKQCSEEKICDLKRGSERRGGSRSRR